MVLMYIIRIIKFTEMNNPTKKQRHEIYKLALEIFQNYTQSKKWYYGLCSSITDAIDKLDLGYYSIKYYPELIKYKPDKLVHRDAFWFNWGLSGTKKRINILKQAIEETKPKERQYYKIPRKVRYQIYSNALKMYEEHVKDNIAIGPWLGMCRFIDESREKIDINLPDPYDKIYQYPEIYKRKPKSRYAGAYWFDINDTTSRIKIFKQAKRETR